MFRNILGIMYNLFRIGGPTGNGIKAETYGLSIRDSAGSVLKNLGIARARAGVDTDAGTYLDIKEKVILIEFSFLGASAPSPGLNTGKYGMCHTTGGLFTAGVIYYDTGVALTAVTSYKGQVIASTSAFSGTVSLVADGVYIATTASAPYGWTLKGDGAPASTGFTKSIQVPITTASGSVSTTSIPSGAEITDVILNVTTAYSGGTTIQVNVNGGTPLTVLDTTENDPTVVGIYAKDQDTAVAPANAGVIVVNIGGAPGVGAGRVIVQYISAFLS